MSADVISLDAWKVKHDVGSIADGPQFLASAESLRLLHAQMVSASARLEQGNNPAADVQELMRLIGLAHCTATVLSVAGAIPPELGDAISHRLGRTLLDVATQNGSEQVRRAITIRTTAAACELSEAFNKLGITTPSQ